MQFFKSVEFSVLLPHNNQMLFERVRYELADKLETWLESRPEKGIEVGDHMRVFAPAVDNKITPNTAEIHFSNMHLPFLGPNDSLLNYSRFSVALPYSHYKFWHPSAKIMTRSLRG